MQLVRLSLADAWQALKNNWIVVWFPVLIGIGFGLLATILIGIVIQLSLGWGVAGQMGGSIIIGVLFAAFMVLIAAAIGAGRTEMFRGAASGEVVQTAHFIAGVKSFTWRFLASYLVLGLFSVVIAAIFMGSAIFQLGYLGTQLISSPNSSPAALLYQVYQAAPAAMLGVLLLITTDFVLSLWAVYVVTDDTGVFPAYAHSFRLIVGNLGPFFILALLSFLVSLLMQALTNGGMLFTILGIIWASYYQLARFALFYQLKSGPAAPPSERGTRQQDPPELLV